MYFYLADLLKQIIKVKSHLLKVIALLFCLNVNHIDSFAQIPYSINYTTENGLLSNTIYEVIQDSNGFVWFATELGISRFDGKQFTNFTKIDGLTDNVCLTLTCDNKNRIWVGLLNGEYCYIENGRVYNKYNNKLIKELNQAKTFGHLTINDNRELIIRGNKCYYKIKTNADYLTTCLTDSSIDNFFTGYERYIYEPLSKSILLAESTNRLMNMTLQKHEISGRRYADFYKGVFTFLSRTTIVQIANNKAIMNNYFSLQNIEVQGIFRHSSAFLILTNKGIYTVPLQQIDAQPILWMDLSTAHNLFIDKDCSIWISTIGNGLIKIPEAKIGLLPVKEGSVSVSNIGNEEIAMGTTNGVLQWYCKRGNEFILQKKNNLFSMIRDIHVFNNHLFALTKFCVFKLNLQAKKANLYYCSDAALKSLSISNDSSIYLSTGSSLLGLNNQHKDTLFISPSINRIYGIIKKSSNSFYVGSERGLLFIQNGKSVDTLIKDKINMTVSISDKLFACATESKGVFLIKDGNVISNYRPKEIKDFVCNSIHYDAMNKELYVGASEGLYFFNLENNSLNFLQQLGEEYGLYKKQIQDISSNNQKLFLATNAGIIVLDKDVSKKENLVHSIYFKSIKANGINLEPSKNMSFTKGTNNIEIEAQAVCFGGHQKLIYAYYLSSDKMDTIVSNDGKITFANLIPGNYKLHVQVRSYGEFNHILSQELSFKIQPYWWQTIYVKIIASLFICMLFIIAFNAYRRRANYKIKNQNLMLDLEIKALRSQMNPHFIFNSLNSAQEYIFNNKPQEANKYLSVFSKMVRMSLNFSSKNMISILDEINYLHLFLKLEKMKYEDKFEYAIHVDEAIVTDYTYIPSMILQPVVENAVVHGVLNKNCQGMITIKFELDKEYIICKVDDDGIGRIESLKRKNRQGNSMSTSNIKHRIKLLNKSQPKHKIEYTIQDKYIDEQTPAGTLFQVKIPLNFNNQ